MTRSTTITIYVCEDDHRLRRTLVRLLEEQDDMAVAGQSGDAETALEDLTSGAPLPCILLLDLELPGMSGLGLLDRLGDITAKLDVLVLTSFEDADAVFQAMRSGAAGYVVKSTGLAALLQALREVSQGGTVIDPRLARRFWNLFQASLGHGQGDPFGLNEKERDVLELLAKGLTNPELGKALGLKRRSVKGILESIYHKMGVSGRVEAVVAAVKAGIVQP